MTDTPIQDPYAEREAEKYTNPIPSRECILQLLQDNRGPMRYKEIASALSIDDEEQLEGLRRRLRAMERDGQVLFNRRGGYGPIDRMNMVRGRVIGHPDGFGFLVPEEGGGDLFLSARQMHRCFHDDRVLVHITGVDERGRREAAIIEVLEHAHHTIAGRYFEEDGVGFFEADNRRVNQDILIPAEHRHGAKHGQLVVVEIIQYPDQKRQACGRVVQVMGDHMAPGLEIDMAIHSHSLPHEWPQEVVALTATMSHQVSEADKEGRIDLRHIPLVTIDGADSKDFDDAVYAEAMGKGWRLLVAIADVSHYVLPDTPLDRVAKERGNSVYFPGRVVPMLPEILSNELCSLNPLVDRLCLVAEIELTGTGKMKKSQFYPAVMNSHARLTYDQVNAILVERDAALSRQFEAVRPPLEELYRLFKVLHSVRLQRGAIDFDTTETRFVFCDNRKIDQIVPVERNDAHRLIEECMLLANTAAAEKLLKSKLAVLYRNHEQPSVDKLTAVREFLSELGLQLKGGDSPEASDYATLLDAIRDREDYHLIQTVLLRSMMQANYSPDNIGHFGLAYEAYTHFTSPIRRYPDLLIHRALKHRYEHGRKWKNYRYSHDDMVLMGAHCSMTERRADEATRDACDWLKCEFMLDRVGQEFEGIISSVTSFGLFVELKSIYVEGLVHISELKNDYYHFDPAKHRLLGEHSRKIYRLGDAVRVSVVRVDLDEHKIDFALAASELPAAPAPKNPKRKKRSNRSKKS
ncbi:ribonuclease R [Ectothiorhodospiraceae bacterium BW-2]|nr:ribonuclease R [Ectothiorhodospiraceae bacterium BW-2]